MMRFSLHVFPFILAISFLSCSSVAAGPLKVVKAIKQHWVSGAPGGRAGVKYTIELSKCNTSVVKIKDIYIGTVLCSHYAQQNHEEPVLITENGNNIQIAVNLINNLLPENSPKPPVSYMGEAFIIYENKRKQRYVTVPAFTVVAPSLGM